MGFTVLLQMNLSINLISFVWNQMQLKLIPQCVTKSCDPMEVKSINSVVGKGLDELMMIVG